MKIKCIKVGCQTPEKDPPLLL